MIDQMDSSAYNLLQSVLPASIWSASKGVGSFLTFDMDEKVKEVIKRKGQEKTIYTGKVHLWIYLAEWKLYKNDLILLDSNSEDEKEYENILKSFIGLNLLRIEELIKNNGIIFYFDNNYKIHAYSDLDTYDENDDLFIFYIKGFSPIAYSPKAGFYMEEALSGEQKKGSKP